MLLNMNSLKMLLDKFQIIRIIIFMFYVKKKRKMYEICPVKIALNIASRLGVMWYKCLRCIWNTRNVQMGLLGNIGLKLTVKSLFLSVSEPLWSRSKECLERATGRNSPVLMARQKR